MEVKIMKKQLLLLLSLGLCFVPATAHPEQSSYFSIINRGVSALIDTTLVVSAVGSGACAALLYMDAYTLREGLPLPLRWAFSYTNGPEIKSWLEANSIFFAGVSVTALSILLLKKLAWEKTPQNTSAQT